MHRKRELLRREDHSSRRMGAACVCGGVHSSPVPERIIPKSIASPSLLSQILASKFCDVFAFYRQANILERDGIEISRATMARWALEAHELLSPLTDRIRVRRSGRVP